MRFISNENEKNIVIEIAGDFNIQSFNYFKDFKRSILEILQKNKKGLIIDISKVKYIDSAGIGVLLMLHNRAYAENRDFCLSNVPDTIIRIFKIIKVYRIFEYHADSDVICRG
ncbi:MAG: STAS domain-containing protein [Spirochaetes bacterium]|nr:STAS domain-containing protein [Spirochaetota bacterium]